MFRSSVVNKQQRRVLSKDEQVAEVKRNRSLSTGNVISVDERIYSIPLPIVAYPTLGDNNEQI